MHYKLIQEEWEAIDAVNSAHKNVLMVVCDHGDGAVIDCEDIERPIFIEYRRLLGETLDPDRIIDEPIFDDPIFKGT